jgi:hypothetical protein
VHPAAILGTRVLVPHMFRLLVGADVRIVLVGFVLGQRSDSPDAPLFEPRGQDVATQPPVGIFCGLVVEPLLRQNAKDVSETLVERAGFVTVI